MYEDEFMNSRNTLFPGHTNSSRKPLPKIKLNRESEYDLAKKKNESHADMFPEYTLMKTGFGIAP